MDLNLGKLSFLMAESLDLRIQQLYENPTIR